MTPKHGAEQWNERFSHPDLAYGLEPSLWLQRYADLFQPGMKALIPADGEGRNGVWLAQQGLQVTSVDYSDVALDKTRALARERGVAVHTVCADLTSWDWPRNDFDLVVAVYLHFEPADRARMHRAMLEAIAPDGYVLIEAFHPDQLQCTSGGPRSKDMLYTEEILREDFADAEIIRLERVELDLEEGRLHQGPAVLTRLLARR